MIKFEEGEVYCFKLNSGEEVIAKVETIGDATLVKDVGNTNNFGVALGLSKPLSVGMGADGPQLIPTMMSGNPQELFWGNIDSCAIVGQIGTDMYEVYNESTSALDLPKEKRILRG